MVNFVSNEEVNEQINNIFRLKNNGMSIYDIAARFTEQKKTNHKNNDTTWMPDDISEIIDNFQVKYDINIANLRKEREVKKEAAKAKMNKEEVWVASHNREPKQTKNEPQQVRVVDIDMPFLSMVEFMIKWALASIPAMIILGILIVGFMIVFGLFGVK